MKVFVSWNGVKDSALACWRSQCEAGIEVTHLPSMLTERTMTSHSQQLPVSLVNSRSGTIRVSSGLYDTSWYNDGNTLKQPIRSIKIQGVTAGIFSESRVPSDRDRADRLCTEAGTNLILRMWQYPHQKLTNALLMIVGNSLLATEGIQRTNHRIFTEDLPTLTPYVDLNGGQAGHDAFVYIGPIFWSPVPFRPTCITHQDSNSSTRSMAA